MYEPDTTVPSLLRALIAVIIVHGGEVFVPDIVTASVELSKDRLEVTQSPSGEGHTIRVVRKAAA